MNKITLGLASVMAVASTSAMAGTAPVPVSEPGMAGIVAAGVVAAIAFARLRGRK